MAKRKEPKQWYDFWTVNGTVKETLELTPEGARDYAKAKGYGLRYTLGKKPPAKKKRAKRK